VEEIARLSAEGPTDDEIDRGRAQTEAQFMFRLQSVGGFGGKSDQLNAYNTFVGDPGFFERDLERYGAVTPATLQGQVRRHLDHARRVALSIVPRGRPDLALPDSVLADVS
jgi:zinc protease